MDINQPHTVIQPQPRDEQRLDRAIVDIPGGSFITVMGAEFLSADGVNVNVQAGTPEGERLFGELRFRRQTVNPGKWTETTFYGFVGQLSGDDFDWTPALSDAAQLIANITSTPVAIPA